VQQKLAEAANTDAMTGLYNQGRFHARVNWAVTDALRRGRPLSLMFIDLDNFKRCNDTHGHPTGDALLRDVSRVLTSCSRSVDDEGFRLGGDEFALLLRGAELGVADRVATRVRDAFSQVERYGTTMSIGLAQLAEGMDADALTAAADEALYKAKASGKDTIRRSGD
jgi:diguanylate cyclase (GGDEF)-like protein